MKKDEKINKTFQKVKRKKIYQKLRKLDKNNDLNIITGNNFEETPFYMAPEV